MNRREILALLFLGSFLCCAYAQEKPEPFPVQGKVTVVDFGASWCAGCPEMSQRMSDMQKEFGQRAAFVVIDIDEFPGIEKKYLIERMPHQRFYDASGEPIWAHNGDIEVEELRDRVNFLIDYSQNKTTKNQP